VPESLKIHRPILVISILLSVQYLVFLLWVVSTQTYYISGSEAGFIDHVIRNSNTLLEALLIDSWIGYPILGLFIAGCLFGFLVNRWVIVYLLVIFAGQLYFSTYMTYASLPWFPQRYLVASYVAFGCICALGTEYLIRGIKNGVSIGITLFLLAGALYSGITSYLHSMNTPIVNQATVHIEKLHCEDRKTVVVSDPVFIGVVPWYAFRNDPTVIIPELSANIDELVSNAVNQGHCIILQEQTKINYYSGNLLEQLSALPGYSGSHSEAGKGYKFLNSAWLFRPNAN
jgi:hypothetical protein